MNNRVQADYRSRIDRVFDFIDENLGSDLSLSTVSDVGNFSPFHFHRIFRFMTGETVKAYVARRRIEKSAIELLHEAVPVTEIAHKFGFGDSSSFSKAFKKYHGVGPAEFRKQNPNRFSKIRQLQSKNGQEYPDHEKYLCIIDNLKTWVKMNAKIDVRAMPKMDLACVSVIGANNLEGAYGRLIRWATPRGLVGEGTKFVTVYHDSFKVTAPDKVRMSAAIMVKGPVESAGEIFLASIGAGRYIVGSFEIGLNDFERAWTGLFLWMNENGYRKGDGNPFEIYHNNFNDHPKKKAMVDFFIPIA